MGQVGPRIVIIVFCALMAMGGFLPQALAEDTLLATETEPAAGPAANFSSRPVVTYMEVYGPYLPEDLARHPDLFGSKEILINDPAIFHKWNGMKDRFYTQLSEGRLPEQMRTLMFHLRTLKAASTLEKVEAANALVNRMRYVSDQANWGQSDFWATPVEFFLRGSGDCEDFAIAKYSFLRALGVPDQNMRLAIVLDRIKRIPHAVLVVYTEKGAMILDNQNNDVLPSFQITRYRPLLSMNNAGGWLHKI